MNCNEEKMIDECAARCETIPTVTLEWDPSHNLWRIVPDNGQPALLAAQVTVEGPPRDGFKTWQLLERPYWAEDGKVVVAQSPALQRVDRGYQPDSGSPVSEARLPSGGSEIYRPWRHRMGKPPAKELLSEDYPKPCAACGKPLKAGEHFAFVELGPGDDEEARRRRDAGRPYNAVAAVAHYDCVAAPDEK